MSELAQNKNHELPQIIAIFASALLGVSEGMLLAWNAPSVPELISDSTKNITLEEASYFTIASPTAMLITAPIFPSLMDIFGRKVVILLVSIPAILAWILVLLNGKLWVYYVSRFLAGMVDAGMFTIVPVYVCEIAQPKARGTWGNIPGISIYVGIFLINLIGAYNNVLVTAAISLAVPVLHFVVFLFMPESPYYFLMKNRDEDARKSLKWLRKIDNVEDELQRLRRDVERQLSEPGNVKDLFVIKSNRRALIVGLIIRVTQQLSGYAAFTTYTQYMFKQSGSNISEKTSSIIFTACIVICTSLSSRIIEYCGRRPLIITSSIGCGIIFIILSLFFYISEYTFVDVSNFRWVPLAAMLMYVLAFSPGLALIPTLMSGELFSNSIKSKAVTVITSAQALCFLIVPKFFQTTTHHFGIFVPFTFFALSCIIGSVLAYFYVVETKGKTLEEIQQYLKGNKGRLTNSLKECNTRL